jgi:TPR repeat protein
MLIVSPCQQAYCDYADEGFLSEGTSFESSAADSFTESVSTAVPSEGGDTVSTGELFTALGSVSGALLYSEEGWVPSTPAPALKYAAYNVTTYNLAMMYAKGLIVDQDKTKACELYEKAAAAGHAKAAYNLGRMYHRGEGVETDHAKAAELYQQAHAKGYRKAARNLAIMYERGEGVEKDCEKAAALFHRFAIPKLGE